jgi:hypothetical protein
MSKEKEIMELRAALSLSVGSLESVNYLLKSSGSEDKKVIHSIEIIERILLDLTKIVD